MNNPKSPKCAVGQPATHETNQSRKPMSPEQASKSDTVAPMESTDGEHPPVPSTIQASPAFDGLLARRPEGWFWPDGTKEDRVWDVPLGEDYRGLPIYGNALHLPQYLADADPRLQWACQGDYPTTSCQDGQVNLDFLRRFPHRREEDIVVYMIPRAVWDKFASQAVRARCHEDDIPKLQVIATRFGYHAPEPDIHTSTEAAVLPAEPEDSVVAAPEDLGPLTRSEICAIFHALSGHDYGLCFGSHNWSLLAGDGTGPGACFIGPLCGDIAGDRLDLHWGIDLHLLRRKLRRLSADYIRLIALGAAAFWLDGGSGEGVIDGVLAYFDDEPGNNHTIRS